MTDSTWRQLQWAGARHGSGAPDPLEDRRPGDLDELPPSDPDATKPQPGRRRPPGTHQPRHLRKAALPHEGELEAGM